MVRPESNSRPPASQPDAQPTEPAVRGHVQRLSVCLAKLDSMPQGDEQYEADTVESQDEDTGYQDEIMPEEVNPKHKKRGKSRRRNRKR